MKKILLLIILLILLFQLNIYLNYEHYYTLFTPFKKTKDLVLDNNKHNFIYDKIIFVTFNEFNDYLQHLIERILKKSNILNIYLYNDNNYKNILDKVNNNIYKFCLLPIPLVVESNYHEYKNLRSIGNISQYEIILFYNYKIKYNLKFTNIKDIFKYSKNNQIIIFTDKTNSVDNYIITNLFKKMNNDNIIIKNESEIENINNILNNKIMFYIFIDFNNNKIDKILNKDYEDKIKFISMNKSDLNLNNNVSYFNKLIKLKYDNINKYYYNTLSFSNIIITNKFVNLKLIYNITKNIYLNLEEDTNLSNKLNFNINLPMLYSHIGTNQFYYDNGLISYIPDDFCKLYVDKNKCKADYRLFFN